MQNHVRRITTLAGAVVMAAAASVQAQTSDTVTDVPFAFAIGGESMPAGTYRVSRLSHQLNVFQVSSLRQTAIVISQPEGPDDRDDSPRLLFYRYGDQYFLREIRLPGNTAYSIPQSRQERDAEERIAGRMAPEVVAVRAQHE
ncbi:MAG: hypothetical protein ACRD1U_01475 [Vicinamibacterales bacterium]